MIILILAATVMAATFIPAAMRHDRLLAELEEIDFDALADDMDQRVTDDADAWRKGES